MLVFTRRRNQVIRIGDGIEVHVLRLGRDGVRLGIVAPAEVAVHREEVYDEIRLANRSAAGQGQDVRDLATRLRRQ
jgi:carbon storage regulator